MEKPIRFTAFLFILVSAAACASAPPPAPGSESTAVEAETAEPIAVSADQAPNRRWLRVPPEPIMPEEPLTEEERLSVPATEGETAARSGEPAAAGSSVAAETDAETQPVTSVVTTSAETALPATPIEPKTAEQNRIYRDAAALYFNRLTEKQKIAQHFISWLPRNIHSREIERQIRSGIGGFIIYPWNFEDRDDLRALTENLHQQALGFNAGIDLFICGDQEGGRVATYRFDDMVRLPSQADWGALNDDWFAYCLGYVNGRQFRELGFNMNLAPVLDLTAIADSSIIGDRALGDDPDTAGILGAAYINGMQAAEIMAVAKHFPGHGVSRVDSHVSLPVSDVDLDALLQRELIPFDYAVQNGVAGIMTAHILFPNIDNRWPVTLSKVFIDEILKSYMGYEGLIISDGLSMGALAKYYNIEETLQRSLNAGVDVLLIHDKYDVNDLIYRTQRMLEEGLISRETIMNGTMKILEAKARYGLLPLTAQR